MENENDSVKILEAIHGLSSRMDSFAEDQKEMKGSIQSLEGSVKSLEGSVKSLERSVGSLEGSVKSLEEGQDEIYEMIQDFSTHVDERFTVVGQRFDSLDGRVGAVEGSVGIIDGRLTRIEATMVTKDYLDDKLVEHGSRYGELIRKTNGKIKIFADALVAEKSLSPQSAKHIVSVEPFGR